MPRGLSAVREVRATLCVWTRHRPAGLYSNAPAISVGVKQCEFECIMHILAEVWRTPGFDVAMTWPGIEHQLDGNVDAYASCEQWESARSNGRVIYGALFGCGYRISQSPRERRECMKNAHNITRGVAPSIGATTTAAPRWRS